MDDSTRSSMSDRSSSDSSYRVCTVTNENWRGKNDPTERRRIQNRINQRAFRQRQREGSDKKQYKPRHSSSEPSSQYDEDEVDSPYSVDEEPEQYASESRTSSAPTTNQPNGMVDSSGRVWDELAQLINRNLMAAASTNAQRLGIAQDTLQSANSTLTPRPTSSGIPATLQPLPPQHQVPHDPIIDIIPHPRLRFNVLRAIAAQQIDAAAFSRDLRASGAMENLQDQWQRGGLVVWSSPEQLASWELSAAFVLKWSFLLQGCEDFLQATNAWRSRRGERLFPRSIGNTR
ncbi:hypothetical protein AC578_8221 [Pseudocercospora eumusae]|uniref:BZIP domain-containing protein n=1 Tax=Pseudocercospora eumusae TaxID=321146 RepID=A0A139HE62_9PEZI|nr:hypothetical protein AC578_8221 [Pseudocercospora eumusae]